MKGFAGGLNTNPQTIIWLCCLHEGGHRGKSPGIDMIVTKTNVTVVKLDNIVWLSLSRYRHAKDIRIDNPEKSIKRNWKFDRIYDSGEADTQRAGEYR